MKQYSYIIVGSGIAGLTLAIKLADHFPNKAIGLITKSSLDESNTKYAQGGIAAVMNHLEDSYENHINDTLRCGDGLCDEGIVTMVVKEGPTKIKELIAWGARFDVNEEGKLDLGKEGGHSANRVIHHKDQTGFEIAQTLLNKIKKQSNIHLLEHHQAVDLLVKENQCYGVFVLDKINRQIKLLQATHTILATGGIGQVYGHTTNPEVATGDGIAMAYRVGAVIRKMEFIQFHPTALWNIQLKTTFLISEAVRGFGAYLRTKEGERFMFRYDVRGELASRDIVSRSIECELKKSGEKQVYIDVTHLNQDSFQSHFPMIYKQCSSLGIDLAKEWIPVAPSQHYLCGGIAVNKNGETSIKELYVCGESACTGLHGANRLASNSLLEALVFSDNIFKRLQQVSATKFTLKAALPDPASQYHSQSNIDEQFLATFKNKVQRLMMQVAGITRKNTDLQYAKLQLLHWQTELTAVENESGLSSSLLELKNILVVAILIVEHSLDNNQNQGAFYKCN